VCKDGGENTLQLADELVVTQSPDGTWFVAVRCVQFTSLRVCSGFGQGWSEHPAAG
jgi:hypothetical protein